MATSGDPPPGWRWVRYTQSGIVGLSSTMMLRLRIDGAVEVRDEVHADPGVDWELLLPDTAEGLAQLVQATLALAKLRQRGSPGANDLST